MLGGINSALSALKSFSKKISNTANNIANINSTGFKKSVTSFQENGNLKGVQIVSNQPVVHTQGSPIPTNNPLNVDIVEESVNLITASSGYKANIKMIKAQDALLGTILDIKE